MNSRTTFSSAKLNAMSQIMNEFTSFLPILSSYVIRLKASPQVFCAKAESTEFGLRTAFMVFKLLLLKISLVINKLDDVAVRVDGFLDCPNRKFAIHIGIRNHKAYFSYHSKLTSRSRLTKVLPKTSKKKIKQFYWSFAINSEWTRNSFECI